MVHLPGECVTVTLLNKRGFNARRLPGLLGQGDREEPQQHVALGWQVSLPLKPHWPELVTWAHLDHRGAAVGRGAHGHP